MGCAALAAEQIAAGIKVGAFDEANNECRVGTVPTLTTVIPGSANSISVFVAEYTGEDQIIASLQSWQC